MAIDGTDIKGFLKDFLIELGAEFLSLSTLKKLMTKSFQTQTLAQPAGSDTESKDSFWKHISDEALFTEFLAKLAASTTVDNGAEAAKKISGFVANKLEKESQRRRFRLVVGHLAQMEYMKKSVKGTEVPPSKKGDTPGKKETITESKVNLGVEFAKSFAKLSDDEMLDVCKAAGIMESPIDRLKKFGEENRDEIMDHIGKVQKAIEGQEPYKGFWRELLGLKPKAVRP